MNLIRETNPVARKEYNCDAWTTFRDSATIADYDWTPSERTVLDRMECLGGKILKGEKYICHTVEDGGEIDTIRSNEQMRDLCLKYDLYDEYYT